MLIQTFVRSYASGAIAVEQSLLPEHQGEACIEQEALGDPDSMTELLRFAAEHELRSEALTELLAAAYRLGQEHPKSP